MLATAVPALLGLLGRSPPPRMGGFEQRHFIPGDGARVGLLVTGSTAAVDQLQQLCRSQLSTDEPASLRGVIYRLTADSAEIVAEGEREALVLLASSVASLGAEAAGVEVREQWQQPLAETGYRTDFPLVPLLTPKMRAHIRLSGTPDALDTIARQLQVEAVFNRGLKFQKARPQPDQLEVTSQGGLKRLKSFVRWCYTGPPLARADSVSVSWEEAP